MVERHCQACAIVTFRRTALLVWCICCLPWSTSIAADRAKILFAIADDWSFGHAGAYGCTWVRTPAFGRVAREGILFTRANTPVAKCAPSRAAGI